MMEAVASVSCMLLQEDCPLRPFNYIDACSTSPWRSSLIPSDVSCKSQRRSRRHLHAAREQLLPPAPTLRGIHLRCPHRGRGWPKSGREVLWNYFFISIPNVDMKKIFADDVICGTCLRVNLLARKQLHLSVE